MVTYDFYVGSYLGSVIPEKAFASAAAQAEAVLARLEQTYTVKDSGLVSRNMALCAMAESIYENAARRGIRSSSVGNVSVQYQDGGEDRYLRQLYQKAAIYLDIYRGVK